MRIVLTIYLLLFLLCFPSLQKAKADNGDQVLGTRSKGMAQASLCLEDPWAARNNPASLAFLHEAALAFFCENRYALQALNSAAFALALPFHGGTWALCASRFGYALLNTGTYGLCYSHSFGKKVAAGLGFDYQEMHIAENYGNMHSATARIGIRIQLLPVLQLGAALFNPTRSKLAGYADERIPTLLNIGFRYDCSRQVCICVESSKDNFNPGCFKAAFEYRPAAAFALRAGATGSPAGFSFGASLRIKYFDLEFASAWQAQPGTTQSAGLRIPLGRKSEP
jgi:hypothetical protein